MDKHIEELLPFYALDALTGDERELVERYLAEHPEARRQVEEMSKIASTMPQSVAPVQPPPHIKIALMRRVNSDAEARLRTAAQSPSAPRRLRFDNFNWFRALGLAAASLLILWVILLNLQVARLRNEVSALNTRLTAQSESLEQVIAKLPQTTSSAVITISLQGTNAQPSAHGQLIADPKKESAILIIAGLPQLEPGKTYQVWLINGGKPASAGLLTVDQNGQGILVVTSDKAIGSFQTLGISVEPKGGSPQPTGDIVVLSQL